MTSAEFIKVFDTIAEAPEGVDRLRELVLQLAVRGKLVPQDSSEASAKVLLKHIYDEKSQLFREGKIKKPKPLSPIATEEAPFDVPDQWEWVRMGDIANSRLGKMLDKSKNKGPYRRYLRNASVQWFRFELSDVLELRLEDADLEEYSVKINDLIVCEGGEPGRAAVCGSDVEGMVFQKALHRVRPWCGISTWYLAYLLRCDTWSQRIDAIFTGATIKHLTGKALATYVVPLPPLSEQYRIVDKINELMGLIDRLEAARSKREKLRSVARDSAIDAIRSATTTEEAKDAWTRIAERMDEFFTNPVDLASLRDAVLQLAVRGRLVRQEPNDEPARVLLDRIGEERAQSIHAKQTRQQKLREPITCSQLKAPEGWTHVYLGDVIDLEYGKSLPRKDRKESGDVPVYGSNGIVGQHDVALVNDSCIVVGRKGSAGAVTLARTPCWPIDTTYFVRPHGGMSLKYTSLMLVCARLEELDRATAIPGLNREEAYLREALLPPLAEQHRIVAKVDELMALIDQLEQHLTAKEKKQRDFATTIAKLAGTTSR